MRRGAGARDEPVAAKTLTHRRRVPMTMPHAMDDALVARIEASAAAIRRRWPVRPEAALVLGTGLHRLASLVHPRVVLRYSDIPGWPRSTATGHRGRLVCGRIGERSVIVMDGRCHGYEGYARIELALPVLTIAALGARTLILSNASGGLNPALALGDVVVVADHLDLQAGSGGLLNRTGASAMPMLPGVAGVRPTGACPTDSSGRHLDVRIYDPELIAQALATARRGHFSAHRGVYVAVMGPSYETRAEYRFLRRIGGDVVGMSTVPEAVAAAVCGVRTLALSIVTNVARPDMPEAVCATDVIRAASQAEPHVRQIVTAVIAGPWPRGARDG